MYAEHFRLDTPVFTNGISQDEQVFRGHSQKSLQTRLAVALTRSDAVAVLYGAPGTGKTTLAASTLRENATKLALGCLSHTPLTPHELLEQLLTEFGFSPYRNSRTERLAIWRQHLAEMSTTATRVCILVEKAEQLSEDVLASLESLTSADPRGGLGANVILTASSDIEPLADAPGLAALRQRVRLIGQVTPFDADETAEYLRFRLERAGASLENLFESGAAHRLHRYSGGIIRVIDNLTESCLGLAAVRGEPRVTVSLIKEVAENLMLEPAHAPASIAIDRAPIASTDALADLHPVWSATDLTGPPTDTVPRTVAGDDVPPRRGPEEHAESAFELPPQQDAECDVRPTPPVTQGPDSEALPDTGATRPVGHEADDNPGRAIYAMDEPAGNAGPADTLREINADTDETAVESASNGSDTALHESTVDRLAVIPVLDDVVDTARTMAEDSIESVVPTPELESSRAKPGEPAAAAARTGIADEDRDQIAMLEAFARSELKGLDGLNELLGHGVTGEKEARRAAGSPHLQSGDRPADDEQPPMSEHADGAWTTGRR